MSHLVLCTWNVHQCVGSDRRRDPERVARVLADIGPDVAALQEVHSRAAGPPDADQGRFLAEAVGLEPVMGTTFIRHGSPYGNVLLTRWPPRLIRRHDLSVPGREPRGAIEIEIDTAGGSVRVVGTHLGLDRGERVRQARTLLGRITTTDPEQVLALLADWNEWWQWGTALRLPRQRFGVVPAPATFPAWRPTLALDRIWVSPVHRLVSLAAHRTRLAARASDHLPVVARIDV